METPLADHLSAYFNVDPGKKQDRPRPSSVGSSSSLDSDSSRHSADSLHKDADSVDALTACPDRPEEVRTTRQKVDRRPPSTFHLKKWKEQTFAEQLCDVATCPPGVHELKDESIDRGPIPTQPLWKEHAFILRVGLVPMALQVLSFAVYPQYQWPAKVAYPIYWISFVSFAIAVVQRLNYYCTKLGTLDEKNIGRDRTPDKHVESLTEGILLYMTLRTAGPFYFYYNKAENPLNAFSWSYPIRLGLWLVILDYAFYVYHRSSHQFDSLWFIHQHHHTTKHPTAILAILASDYQEILEIALVPLLATLAVPMTFHELYLTLCYTIYVEMLGHSGVRAHWAHPVLSTVLKPFDMDLAVEDHDLHHRFGKSGKNYGKQSRVWDKLFNTSAERIETFGC